MRTLLIGFIILFFCITNGSAQMTIHHINVQQGDATLIEFQTAAILLDAGGSRTNAVKNHLLEYLDQFFEDRPHLKKTLYSVIGLHALNNTIAYGAETDGWGLSLSVGAVMLAGCMLGPRLLHGPRAGAQARG